MHRGALRLGVFVLALTACARAFAHGIPPDAYAVMSHDSEGLRAVSTSAGVAQRRSAQRFQFICPAAWGDQFAAPVAALADGTIVVGASSGLMLLAGDGSLRAHPDPAAVGRSTDVVRSARGVFALRTTLEGSEVLAVDAQTVRVLWKDTKSLYSLAALDDKLVLLRESGRMLEQVTLAAADGAVLDRQLAAVDLPVDYVFARANAGAAYALVVFSNATMALGSVSMNTFSKLAEGELSIAGPLSLDSGTLLALDGRLAQLIDGRATPLADAHNVVCLAQYDGLTYACDSDGIARVSGQALGEPLFRFSWLAAPDLDRVPAGEARMRCNMQWQDLRVDLELNGTLLDDYMPIAGGASAPQAGFAAPPPSTVIAPAGAAAGGGSVGVPAQETREAGTSCAALPGQTRPRMAGALGFVFAIVFVRRRRGRSRRS